MQHDLLMQLEEHESAADAVENKQHSHRWSQPTLKMLVVSASKLCVMLQS